MITNAENKIPLNIWMMQNLCSHNRAWKSFVCTQYSVLSKKDNSKSKSSKEINLYFTKLTQCQHLGTVYILRFWKEFWLI